MTKHERGTRLAGVFVDPVGRADAAATVHAAAADRRSLAVHLCNSYVLELARRDPGYASLLDRGDLNIADGAPVRWLLRRAGHPIVGESTWGVELVHAVAALTIGTGVSHVLHGSTPEVVEAMRAQLEDAHPGIDVAIAESPPFRPLTGDEFDDLLARIEDVAPAVVWIGTGTPRQDQLVDRLVRAGVGAPVVPVGAAFDFIAGTTARAPLWMRRAGLAWLFRLAVDPRRLWRRYVVDSTSFVWHAVREDRER